MKSRFSDPTEIWIRRWDASIRARLGVTQISRWMAKPEGSWGPMSYVSVEAWNACKIQTLAKPVRERFGEFWIVLDELGQSRGVQFLIWDAVRSLRRQVELYRRGRTQPGKIVTHTIASSHMWGLAIDVVTWSGGRVKFRHPKWWVSDALPLAEAHGLSSLYLRTGKDPAHIEAPTTPEVRKIARELRASFGRLATL